MDLINDILSTVVWKKQPPEFFKQAFIDADGSNSMKSITKMNFIGNYYKAGVNSMGNLAFSESTPSAREWFSGSCMNGSYPDDPWSLVNFSKFSVEDIEAYKQSGPIPVPAVNTDGAMTAYRRVLAQAGAVLLKRDDVDKRIISDAKNGAGKIINDEEEVGGWPELKSVEPPIDCDQDSMPDDWEKRHDFDPVDPADRNADADAGGYTNLEEYLNKTEP
jgi:hypothetical protein